MEIRCSSHGERIPCRSGFIQYGYALISWRTRVRMKEAGKRFTGALRVVLILRLLQNGNDSSFEFLPIRTLVEADVRSMVARFARILFDSHAP